jgi:hypothetical protein
MSPARLPNRPRPPSAGDQARRSQTFAGEGRPLPPRQRCATHLLSTSRVRTCARERAGLARPWTRPQPTAACRGGGQRSADHAPAAYLARTYVRARVISCANSHGFGEARTCDSVRREATEPPPDCLAKAALVLLVGLDEFEESADFEVFLGRVAHVPMLVDAVVVAAAVALALHVSGFD